MTRILIGTRMMRICMIPTLRVRDKLDMILGGALVERGNN